MTKQTKQVVLYASVIGAAVASVTTAIVLLIHRKRKKLAKQQTDPFDDSCLCEDALSEGGFSDGADENEGDNT